MGGNETGLNHQGTKTPREEDKDKTSPGGQSGWSEGLWLKDGVWRVGLENHWRRITKAKIRVDSRCFLRVFLVS